MTVTPSTVPQAADVRPVTGRWARLLPWSSVLHVMRSGNPLFNREASRLPHGGTPDDLGRWTRRIAFLTLLFVLIVTSLVLSEYVQRYGPGSSEITHDDDYDEAYPVYGIVTLTLVVSEFYLHMLSILASLLIDFSSLHAGRTEAQRDRFVSQNGLLTIIPLSEHDRFVARHTLALLRSWWAVILVVTLRLGTGILHFAPVVIPNPHLSGQPDPLRALRFSDYYYVAAHPTSLSIPTLLAVLFEFAVYAVLLLEPFWRQRAMTALGLAMGSSGRRFDWSVAMRWLPGLLLIVLTLWLTFNGFKINMGYPLWIEVAQSLDVAWRSISNGSTSYLLIQITVFAVQGLLFFGYYRLIAGMSARVAEARLGEMNA